MDDYVWEGNFLTSLRGVSSTDTPTVRDDEEDNEDNIDDVLSPPKLKSFKETIQSLEDVQNFLQTHGCTHIALSVGNIIGTVAPIRYSSGKQQTLHDYFTSSTHTHTHTSAISFSKTLLYRNLSTKDTSIKWIKQCVPMRPLFRGFIV